MAFVVEAKDDAEMPEQILGCVSLNHLEPDLDQKPVSDFMPATQE
jgi:hypothetical protein